MKANKTGRLPTVRVKQDPVTGQLSSVILDNVQRAFERLVVNIDTAMLALSTADHYRLAHQLISRIEKMVPHTGGDGQ